LLHNSHARTYLIMRKAYKTLNPKAFNHCCDYNGHGVLNVLLLHVGVPCCFTIFWAWDTPFQHTCADD